MPSSPVPSERRFSKTACPICGGRESDPRGEGQRCIGFISADGTYAHCSREEQAGSLTQHPKTCCYPHKLHGPCKCGVQHGEPEPNGSAAAPGIGKGTILATYDYTDEAGELLYQVVRFAPKKFLQRRKVDSGEWEWNLRGTRRVLYRLPKLLDPETADDVVLLVEGEKDVHAAEQIGFLATCNPMGAGKWSDDYCAPLRGHQVVVIPDADEVGRKHAVQVVASLQHAGVSARMVELEAKDLSAWVGAGGTRAKLESILGANRKSRLIDAILQRATDPWVPLSIGETPIVEVPPGGHVVIDGPTGSGKTAIAACILAAHAIALGPAIYITLELSPEMIAARVVSIRMGATWTGVLRGTVERQPMLEAFPDRLIVVDGASLDAIAEIQEARAEHPAAPILVCIDYIQLAAIGDDMRSGVAERVEALRKLAEKERVAMLIVSQPSRAAARELRAGEIMGAQTIGVSAESAQVERGATATVAIGGMGPPDSHGWSRVDISIGKGRFGGGDTVWPARYHGASGQWKIDGLAKPAAEVRAERESDRNNSKVEAARLAMVQAASEVSAPASLEELRQKASCNRDVARLAVKVAVAAGQLVECPPRRRTKHPTYWTPEKQDSEAAKGRANVD